jgi:hypothetical protein
MSRDAMMFQLGDAGLELVDEGSEFADRGMARSGQILLWLAAEHLG